MRTTLQRLWLLAMMLCATLGARAYDACINGIYYDFSETTATVTSGDNEYTGSVIIPESVTYNGNTYSVTTIGDYAFCYCTGLTSIVIPKSITSIFLTRYYYAPKHKITGMSPHYRSAFTGCSNLTSVTINSDAIATYNSDGTTAYLQGINFNRIFGNQVKHYIFGDDVTKIGGRLLTNCDGIETISIGRNVASIGVNPFLSSDKLQSIVVQSGNSAYDSRGNCNAIIETSTNKLISGCKNTIIPSDVETIGESAFSNCYGLTSIDFPNSVTTIDYFAFSNCKNLVSIAIGNNVTSIGTYAFQGCTNIERIVVDDGNTVYDSRGNCNAIINTATNTLLVGCKNTIIPNGIVQIGHDAFLDCNTLTSISIPSSVSGIGEFAFYGCDSLTTVIVAWNTPIQLGDSDIFSNASKATLYVPKGSKAAYEEATYWKNFK